VLLAATAGLLLPLPLLRWVVAGTLMGFGVIRLMRHRHVRWGGMRMSAAELAVWSFLMASAHGAGLMVLPFVLGGNGPHTMAAQHHHGVATLDMSAPLIHSFAYLAVTGCIAVLVYEKVGLRILRHGWINLDLVWAVGLIAAGVTTLLL
jgi:hypothetical protein